MTITSRQLTAIQNLTTLLQSGAPLEFADADAAWLISPAKR